MDIQSSSAPPQESLAKFVGAKLQQALTASGQAPLDPTTLEQVVDHALEDGGAEAGGAEAGGAEADADAPPASPPAQTPAIYGSNARPAYARTGAGSISLLA